MKRIGLFGLYCKDEQKKESDIDILVKFKKGKKTFDNYMDLKFFLEDMSFEDFSQNDLIKEGVTRNLEIKAVI